MAAGSIIFVHGTGVRLKNFKNTFQTASQLATSLGFTQTFVPCAWGDPLGVEFQGRSLPDPPSQEQLRREEEDFARWNWLFDDALFELDKLTIRDLHNAAVPSPNQRPVWGQQWDKIYKYRPSQELALLLERGDLARFWARAWSHIMGSPIPKRAFEVSATELADATHALARALVAQMWVYAAAEGIPGPNRFLRQKIVDRLIEDWEWGVLGLSGFLWERLSRAATWVLRSHRDSFSDPASLPIGDVLLYQCHGAKIRDFIRKKIDNSARPVTVVAHSLGGIACFDLLALPKPPRVDYFVTAGSQSPLLYEIGALTSLMYPSTLPPEFPLWSNFYDRNDFLSYFAGRLFPPRPSELQTNPGFTRDRELESGLPFPASHSAYFTNESFWLNLKEYMPRA